MLPLLDTNTMDLSSMFESCNEAHQRVKSRHHSATHFSESWKSLYIALGVLDYMNHSGEIHIVMNLTYFYRSTYRASILTALASSLPGN
jgi:hypothetical protein